MAYCKSVTILNRSEKFRADPGTIDTVSKNPNVKVITSAVPKEVKGDKFVSSIVYTDAKSNKNIELPVTGIFVEIGSLPNTNFIKDLIALDEHNHIPVDAKNQKTKVAGIWAAGDCTDGLYHQNNIAAGDAVKAIEDIYSYLRAR
jgi:thioredoxin reductase